MEAEISLVLTAGCLCDMLDVLDQKTQEMDMPRSYYDDNFGHWHDMDDEDVHAYYLDTQRRSVRKKCQGCGRSVRILPDYAYCNSCADKREQGWDM